MGPGSLQFFHIFLIGTTTTKLIWFKFCPTKAKCEHRGVYAGLIPRAAPSKPIDFCDFLFFSFTLIWSHCLCLKCVCPHLWVLKMAASKASLAKKVVWCAQPGGPGLAVKFVCLIFLVLTSLHVFRGSHAWPSRQCACHLPKLWQRNCRPEHDSRGCTPLGNTPRSQVQQSTLPVLTFFSCKPLSCFCVSSHSWPGLWIKHTLIKTWLQRQLVVPNRLVCCMPRSEHNRWGSLEKQRCPLAPLYLGQAVAQVIPQTMPLRKASTANIFELLPGHRVLALFNQLHVEATT